MLPLFQSTPTVKILSSAAISNSMFPFVVPRYGRAFTASSALLGGRLVAKSSSVIHSIQHKNHHYHHHESSHRRLFHHTGLQSWSSKADLTDDDGSASIKYYNTRGQESKEQSGSDVDENIDYLKMVLQAKVYDVADESPLTYAKNISRRMNNSIHLKREDLQRVFSFKLRGAYNKIVSLSKTQRNKGVICASAGNHAQGVALAAKKLGIKSTIVMPVFAPKIKVNNVKSLGGNVILYGDDFDAAKAECTRLIEETGMTFIHPFDDPHVIAGQGTIGMEILRQYNSDEEIDGIFVCVGGGGLLAGIAEYVKIIAPHVKVYGVEAEDAAAMTASLDKGERVTLDEVGLFADGAAVREVGEETFRVVQKRVDGMVLVNNDEICSAIKDTFEDTRSILEPAGALSLAGCKKFITQNQITQGNYVCITSGANMNFNRLRFVANRSEIGDGNEALISVTIPEKPGTFHQLHSILHPRNVTELTYRFDDAEQANVIFGYTPARPNDTSDVMEALAKLDFDPRDLTDDEFAKTHVRFLAGGRSKTAVNERIIRFEFPDRPGALKRFLDCLREKGRLDRHGNPVQKVTLSSDTPWNCSLFHYRNYGSDTGKVLAGIQVPPEDSDEFELFLENLGYRYTEETNHWLYSRYLN